MKSTYIAVTRGIDVGLFTNWPAVEKLTVKFDWSCEWKSFTSRADAESWLKVNVFKLGKTKISNEFASLFAGHLIYATLTPMRIKDGQLLTQIAAYDGTEKKTVIISLI